MSLEKEIDVRITTSLDSGAMVVAGKWHDEAYYYYQASGAMLKGYIRTGK